MHAGFRYLLLLAALCVAFGADIPLRAADEKPDPAVLAKKKTLELEAKARAEYEAFLKRPETTIEFWVAIKFEMELGKFDLAAFHLKSMLGKNEKVKVDPDEKVDADLVKLEQADGMSAFLRLRQVRPKDWSDYEPFQKEAVDNVELLIDRVTKAVEKHLSNPDRIKKYIGQLGAKTGEERAFAYVQLARSRERAVPYLVEALRVNYGKAIFPALRETMLRMGPETVPVYLEAFKAQNEKDYRDVELRMTLLEIVKQRDDTRVIPYLYDMSASKKYPEVVRKKAKETLASLLRVDPADLPPAKEALVQLAERYYQHKVAFHKNEAVKIWEWDGQGIALTPTEINPYRAEELFGLRHAREALDLDPAYQPAQVVLLNLTLDRFYRPKYDQILMEPMPAKMQKLLTTIDADLVMAVLERAMEDRQLPVILPLIQALGERGEYRAARLNPGGQPRGVIRALYYPDRRVQYAAVRAMLRMPPSTTPAIASDRIVELSRRFLMAEETPKALVVNAPLGQEPAVRDLMKDLGFTAEIARKSRDAIEKGSASADFDLVILHRGMADQDFSFVYGQVRKNYELAALPMLVVVTKEREKIVKKLVGKDPSVLVLTEDKFKSGDELKDLVEKHLKDVIIARLTKDERKEFARTSLGALWLMAKGEIKGYDVMPAVDALHKALDSKDHALIALETIARLPGKDIQYRLMGIVSDPAREKLRLSALSELNRHIQKHGLLLDTKQVAELTLLAREAPEANALLRAEFNVTMSLISRQSPPQTGADLLKFRP